MLQVSHYYFPFTATEYRSFEDLFKKSHLVAGRYVGIRNTFGRQFPSVQVPTVLECYEYIVQVRIEARRRVLLVQVLLVQ
jgi:hypothetical protein